MKNHELWFGTAYRRGGFCHAPPRPLRGTSPSPREVFDRATFPTPHNWHIIETNGNIQVTSRESVLAPSWMYEGTYSLETQDRTRALLLTSGLISADGQLRPLKT